jgi:hypothetical protein
MIKLGHHKNRLKPFAVTFVITVVSYLIYYGSRSIQNQPVHQTLALLFGTSYFLSIFCGPFYIYTTTYLQGVPTSRRILLSCLIPFLWITKDILVLTESHPFVECLYWYLNPMHIWVVCLLSIEMGLGSLTARYFQKRRGQSLQVVTRAPIATILVAIVIMLSIYAWGQGENLFSIYLVGYRFLFGYGV